jgi:hypothetical protein
MAIDYTDSFNYGKQGTGPKTVQKKKIEKPKPKPASYDKSTWDTKTKVSQGTIDQIKSMGMSKALGSVKGAAASSKDDSSAKAFAEGVRRLYGDKRYNAAVGKPAGKVAPRNAVMAGKAEDSRATKTSNFKYGSGNAPASTKKPENKVTNTGRKVAAVGAAALTAVALKKLGPVGAAMAAKGAVQGLSKNAASIGKGVTKLISKPKAVGTKAEYQAKSASDASRKIIQQRMAKKASAKLSAGEAMPGKKNIGTANEFTKKREQDAMRKEIRARMAKKAAASSAKKTVKKKVISNKKLAASTGASTVMLSGDSVKKK